MLLEMCGRCSVLPVNEKSVEKNSSASGGLRTKSSLAGKEEERREDEKSSRVSGDVRSSSSLASKD